MKKFVNKIVVCYKLIENKNQHLFQQKIKTITTKYKITDLLINNNQQLIQQNKFVCYNNIQIASITTNPH
jgi:hypothetical protein